MCSCEKLDAYIAGAMRGYPNNNYDAFKKAAEVLTNKGLTFFDPSQENDSHLPFETCMRKDLNAVVNMCDTVVLIEGWRKSIGANAEVFSAMVCGKPVFELHGETLVKIDTSIFQLPYLLGQ